MRAARRFRLAHSLLVLSLLGAQGCSTPVGTASPDSVGRPTISQPLNSPPVVTEEATGTPSPSPHPGVQIGLDDPRLGEFLDGREYSIASVEERVTDAGHPSARVTVSLRDPAQPQEWIDPEACSIYRESEEITGVVWLADLVDQAVVAYSPQWDGSVSCV